MQNSHCLRLSYARLAGVVAFCLAALPAETAMWSLTNDFLTSPNTSTSRWQYLHATDGIRDGSYLQMAYFSLAYGSNPGLQGWDAFATDSLDPSFIKNITETNITWGSSTIPGGAIRVGPGTTASDLGIVGWLCPSNMVVSIQCSLTDIDPNSGPITWWLDKGSSSGNLASGSLSGNTSTNFSVASLDVAAGDMIFLVMNNAGHPAYDNYAVEISIFQIPEVPTVPMLVVPLLLLVARRKVLPKRQMPPHA